MCTPSKCAILYRQKLKQLGYIFVADNIGKLHLFYLYIVASKSTKKTNFNIKMAFQSYLRSNILRSLGSS